MDNIKPIINTENLPECYDVLHGFEKCINAGEDIINKITKCDPEACRLQEECNSAQRSANSQKISQLKQQLYDYQKKEKPEKLAKLIRKISETENKIDRIKSDKPKVDIQAKKSLQNEIKNDDKKLISKRERGTKLQEKLDAANDRVEKSQIEKDRLIERENLVRTKLDQLVSLNHHYIEDTLALNNQIAQIFAKELSQQPAWKQKLLQGLANCKYQEIDNIAIYLDGDNIHHNDPEVLAKGAFCCFVSNAKKYINNNTIFFLKTITSLTMCRNTSPLEIAHIVFKRMKIIFQRRKLFIDIDWTRANLKKMPAKKNANDKFLVSCQEEKKQCAREVKNFNKELTKEEQLIEKKKKELQEKFDRDRLSKKNSEKMQELYKQLNDHKSQYNQKDQIELDLEKQIKSLSETQKNYSSGWQTINDISSRLELQIHQLRVQGEKIISIKKYQHYFGDLNLRQPQKQIKGNTPYNRHQKISDGKLAGQVKTMELYCQNLERLIAYNVVNQIILENHNDKKYYSLAPRIYRQNQQLLKLYDSNMQYINDLLLNSHHADLMSKQNGYISEVLFILKTKAALYARDIENVKARFSSDSEDMDSQDLILETDTNSYPIQLTTIRNNGLAKYDQKQAKTFSKGVAILSIESADMQLLEIKRNNDTNNWSLKNILLNDLKIPPAFTTLYGKLNSIIN